MGKTFCFSPHAMPMLKCKWSHAHLVEKLVLGHFNLCQKLEEAKVDLLSIKPHLLVSHLVLVKFSPC